MFQTHTIHLRALANELGNTMAYKVIFLFDIGDLYTLLEEAVERLLERKPHLKNRHSPHELISAWFRNQLDREAYLLIHRETEHEVLRPIIEGDLAFRAETEWASRRLYHQISLAVYPNAHPCLESYCQVKLNRFNLMLTFDVGPIDYGAVRT